MEALDASLKKWGGVVQKLFFLHAPVSKSGWNVRENKFQIPLWNTKHEAY